MADIINGATVLSPDPAVQLAMARAAEMERAGLVRVALEDALTGRRPSGKWTHRVFPAGVAVVYLGEEVSWRACDLALQIARQDRSAIAEVHKWILALPRAMASRTAEVASTPRFAMPIAPWPTADAIRLEIRGVDQPRFHVSLQDVETAQAASA